LHKSPLVQEAFIKSGERSQGKVDGSSNCCLLYELFSRSSFSLKWNWANDQLFNARYYSYEEFVRATIQVRHDRKQSLQKDHDAVSLYNCLRSFFNSYNWTSRFLYQ